MASIPSYRFTIEQYLEIERKADSKSEYVNGEMVAMAGASENHNIISFNITRELGNQLRGGPCLGMTGDMKVNVGTEFYYPDIVVACGERRYLDNRRDILLNPTVIIEVLSPSTERYDRRIKLGKYMKIASVREILLVAQEDVSIEHFTHDVDGDWGFTVVTDLEAIVHLPSIDCTLAASAIYEKIDVTPTLPDSTQPR